MFAILILAGGSVASSAETFAQNLERDEQQRLGQWLNEPEPAGPPPVNEWRARAERGDVLFQMLLGLMYEQGRVVAQDHAEAVRWYRKAAEQGDAGAQYMLGTMYAGGRGVPQDYAEAVKWYRKAAERGDASSQSSLGASYFAGRGVPQNYTLAYIWLNLAASKLSGTEREEVVKARDWAAERLTREELTRAQQIARDWKPTKPKEKLPVLTPARPEERPR